MNTVLPFASDATVRDVAGLWIARLDRGITATEKVELQHWLHQNPRHRATLLEMSALWDRMDILSEISELSPLERRVEGAAWLRWPAMTAALGLVAILAALLGFWLRGTNGFVAPKWLEAPSAQNL